MRHMHCALLMLTLAGCRYHPDPVPLRGDLAELRLMAGRWSGSYTGFDSRRSGMITFEISANADSAFGDVLLTGRDELEPIVVIDPRESHLRHATSLQSLNIRFVRISGGRVRGTLEPYRAPDCGCVARTVFTGSVAGDTIRGTFETLLDNNQRQQGMWRVARRTAGHAASRPHLE